MDGTPVDGTPHRGLRRALIALVIVVLVAGGVIGLLAFFNARDSPTVDQPGPGRELPDQGARHLRPGEPPGVRYNSQPPTSGPHVPVPIERDATQLSDDQLLHALELGNVVLVYGSARPPAALTALADDVAGPFDPSLAATGQAVILARRPGTPGVIALAWRHDLRAASAADPQLREFADYWLGRGAR